MNSPHHSNLPVWGWFDCSFLELNVGKKEEMSFVKKHDGRDGTIFLSLSLEIRGQQLQSTNSLKSFGMVIDDRLSYDTNVMYKTAEQRLHLLRKVHGFALKCWRQCIGLLLKAFFLLTSQLGMATSSSKIRRLVTVINQAGKIIGITQILPSDLYIHVIGKMTYTNSTDSPSQLSATTSQQVLQSAT